MFEKFKEKCKAFTRNRAAVVTVIVMILALTVVLSVSIATNRAKKKYSVDDVTDTNGQHTTEAHKQTEAPIKDGTVEAPTHNATERPVSGEIEEFKISLPTSGTIAKGHDATIQVWSETMGDYRVHLGIDIATTDGAPVCAVADGVVEKVWDDALMGRCMAIAHEGNIYTFYKNLSTTLESGIKEGSEVKSGQKIGTVGSTAISELADEPHLHLEMTVNGLAVDPRDYFNNEAKDALNSTNTGK